jgi:hypothetical protein
MRHAYKIFVGRPDGNRPLGRPRRRWVDSIKMDLKLDVKTWTALRNCSMELLYDIRDFRISRQ